ISAVDHGIFEYTSTGEFVEEYLIDGLIPTPQTPQGLAFGPCTDREELQCLFVADGGIDNAPDGQVYEVRIGSDSSPYYTSHFKEERYSFGPIPENAIPGREIG